jgi:hypothetical protein
MTVPEALADWPAIPASISPVAAQAESDIAARMRA